MTSVLSWILQKAAELVSNIASLFLSYYPQSDTARWVTFWLSPFNRQLVADLVRAGFIYAPKYTARSRILCATCEIDWVDFQRYFVHELIFFQAHRPECVYHYSHQKAAQKLLREIYPSLGAEGHQIRLLVLLPGSLDHEIHCELETASLDHPPKYEALSYTWKDPPMMNVIYFCGRLWLVTESLKRALRRLRHGTEKRILWVDALCINQNDKAEVNEQVGVMRKIYEGCQECLVWLGDLDQYCFGKFTLPQQPQDMSPIRWYDDGRDQTLVDQFFQRHTQFAASSTTIPPFPDKGLLGLRLEEDCIIGALCLLRFLSDDKHLTDMPFFRNWSGNLEHLNILWPHCIQGAHWLFFGRPYWYRIWIIQEITVSPKSTIYCDRFIFPLNMVFKACRNLNRHCDRCCFRWKAKLPMRMQTALESIMVPVKKLAVLRTAWLEYAHNPQSYAMTLGAFLRDYRTRMASEPRDKIYALLGLVRSWGNNPEIIPDYEMDPAELYTRVTWHMICSEHSLNILSIYCRDSRKFSLPSWVPDWSVSDPEDTDRWDFSVVQENFSNVAPKPCPPPALLNPRTLRVCSVNIDQIAALGPTFWGHKLSELIQTMHRARALAGLDQVPQGAYLGGEDLENAFWRTVFCDMFHVDFSQGKPRRATPQDIANMISWWSWIQDNPANVTGSAAPVPTSVHQTFNWFVWIAHGKTIFRTKKGYLGLSNGGIRIGDQVHALMGANYPFILRSVGIGRLKEMPRTECHQLISGCYLHGVMDGELTQGLPETSDDYSSIFII